MACDIELAETKTANDPCTKLLLGQQIPIILYQDTAGTAPELVATGGNQAAFQAALTATGEDQLFMIKNLAAGVRGDATDQTLTGNDTPYGVTQLTDRANTITARAQYLSAADNTALDNLNLRGGLVRFWIVDDKDVIQGPFENASIIAGALTRAGLGQAIPAGRTLTVSWNSLTEAPISSAAKPFIRSLVNAA